MNINFLNKLILVLIILNFKFTLIANVFGRGLGRNRVKTVHSEQVQEGIGDEENVLLGKRYINTSRQYVINGQTVSEQELVGIVSVYTVLKLGAHSVYNLCAGCCRKRKYSKLENN